MKMFRNKWIAVIIASGLCLASAQRVHAAEPDSGAVALDEIVVTATKTEKKIDEVPGSVTIIGKEELKSQNIQTVDDALDTLSGVFVKRNKGMMDSTASVRFRGFSGDQYTLILLDGQPLNDAYTGGLEWGAIPVHNIERIEVIRGAASALYGGNAMGGVVNIITSTPEKLTLEAGSGYGTNQTKRYHFSAGNRYMDRLSIQLGYENESTDGYPTTPVASTISSGNGNVTGGYAMNDKHGNPTRWVVGDRGDNSAEHTSFNGKLTFDFSDTGQLSLLAVSGKHEYEYGRPNSYMGTFGDNSTYAIAGTDQRVRFRPNDFISYTGIGENETQVYSMSFKEYFGPVLVNAQIGTVQVDDRYTTESGSGLADYDDSAGTLKETENESWFSELRADLPVGRAHTLTVGTSYRKDTSDTNDYDVPFYRSFSGKGASTFYSGGSSKTWAAFIQDEWRILDPLTIYAGLRYDSWKVYDGASGDPGAQSYYASNTESEISPKVSAVWRILDDTSLKASVGHAFRPPNLYELFRTWTSYGTLYQSNPDLDPETVWTYEMGVDQYFFDKRTKISLTGYRNDIKDLIYYQVIGSTKLRSNAGEARTYGLELEASHKVTDWLTLWGNYTYTDAQITENDTDPASENKQVTGIPENAFNIGLDTRYKWFKGSIVGRYFSKIYNDSDNADTEDGVYGTYEPAFFLDAKITVTPVKWVEVYVCAENLFDEDYYEYYQNEGRTVFAGITLKY